MSASGPDWSESDRSGLMRDGLSRAAHGMPELAPSGDTLDLLSDLEPLPPLMPGFWMAVVGLFALPVLNIARGPRLLHR